jgi:hypothetical protein
MKTWNDVKQFVNNLTDEQLSQQVKVEKVDDMVYSNVEFGVVYEDIYMYDRDNEDIGTMKILRECHEDDFDESLCDLITSKGAVYIAIDN